MRFTLSIRPSAPLLHFDSLSSFLAFWLLRWFLHFVGCFRSFVSFVRRFSSLFIPSLSTSFVSFLFRFSFVAPLSQLPTGPVSLSTLSSPPCFPSYCPLFFSPLLLSPPPCNFPLRPKYFRYSSSLSFPSGRSAVSFLCYRMARFSSCLSAR